MGLGSDPANLERLERARQFVRLSPGWGGMRRLQVRLLLWGMGTPVAGVSKVVSVWQVEQGSQHLSFQG